MSNVVTHPRFDRPPVDQPHPRRRKGTISFRKRLAEALMAKRLNGRSTAQVREDSQRALFNIEEMRARMDELPLIMHVPPDELDRVLKAGGLCRGVSLVTGCCIIMRDEDGPPAA